MLSPRTNAHIQPKEAPHIRQSEGTVYCPMCTHSVQASVVYWAKHAKVAPGQRCPRCSASLDAGYVIHFHRVA